MATAKRTSDITVALYEWNKLTTRDIYEDDKEIFGDGFDFVWDGKTPEIDLVVLDNSSRILYLQRKFLYTIQRPKR